jgi:transcriptional regulator with XRE-family HTH domain
MSTPAKPAAGEKLPLESGWTMPRRKQSPADFGERLATIRKARGLTQVQLAEAAGTTQRAISYYETEAGFPPMPAVIALARVLKVSTDELMGIEQPRADLLQDDPETRRLWKKFQQVRDLPEKDQRAVIRLVNSLAAARRPGDTSPPPGD